MMEDETVGWHHHHGHGFGWTLGVGGEAWWAAVHGVTVSDMTEQLN